MWYCKRWTYHSKAVFLPKYRLLCLAIYSEWPLNLQFVRLNILYLRLSSYSAQTLPSASLHILFMTRSIWSLPKIEEYYHTWSVRSFESVIREHTNQFRRLKTKDSNLFGIKVTWRRVAGQICTASNLWRTIWSILAFRFHKQKTEHNENKVNSNKKVNHRRLSTIRDLY